MKRFLIAATTLGSVVLALFVAPPANAVGQVDVLLSGSTVSIISNLESVSFTVTNDASGQTVTVTRNSGDLSGVSGCTGNSGQVTCTSGSVITNLEVTLKASSPGDVVVVNDLAAHPISATISGSNGSDSLTGGFGNDTLLGKDGNDTLDGENGRDMLSGGPGSDLMKDTGTDAMSAAANYGVDYEGFRTTGVTVTLDGVANDGNADDANADNVSTGIDTILGTDFADSLTGDAYANLLDGRAGDDSITGGAGADRFIGQWGHDTLYARDGEVDTEINCSNSMDGSANENPNTAFVDANDPETANCSDTRRLTSETGSGSGGGGSGSGGGASETVYSTAKPVTTKVSWTVPGWVLPQGNDAIKNGFTFSALDDVQEDLASVQLPIMVQITKHPLKEVPAQYQAGIENGDIFNVEPAVGTQISGAMGSPTWINLHVYETSKDDVQKGKRCPYQGKLTYKGYRDRTIESLFEYTDLSEAESLAEFLKCDFDIVKYRKAAERDLDRPIVGNVKVVRNKSAGRGRYVMEWTVLNPTTQGLAVLLGPRDPRDWTKYPQHADDFNSELTLDTNMELHGSTGNKTQQTALRVWVLDKTDGLFVGQATVEAWYDGELLMSVSTNVSTGGVVLPLRLKGSGMLRISALYEDAFGNATAGYRDVWVTNQDDEFVTADGRCFHNKNDKWNDGNCDVSRKWKASAKSLRDRVTATRFVGFEKYKNDSGIADLRAIAKNEKVTPGLLGPGSKAHTRSRGAGFLEWAGDVWNGGIRMLRAIVFGGDKDTGEIRQSLAGTVPAISVPAADSGAVLSIGPEEARVVNGLGFKVDDAAVVAGEKAGLIAAGGQNLIAAGGQNLIAAGGQNADGDGTQDLIADGAQNMVGAIEGANLYGLDGGKLAPPAGLDLGPAMLSDKGLGDKQPNPKINFEIPLSPLKKLDPSGLINLDGGGLINLDGSGLINLDGSG